MLHDREPDCEPNLRAVTVAGLSIAGGWAVAGGRAVIGAFLRIA